jgi:hypothetical protein
MRLRPLSRPSGDTLGRFVFEITTITVGILIALWVDEARETRRDESLVRSAHEALAREISGNLRDVNGTQGSRDAHLKALEAGLAMIEDRLANRPMTLKEIRFELNSPSFTKSAWDTASRTGALAFMDYGAIAEYAELYDLQDLVDQTQQRYVQMLTEQSAQLSIVTRNSAGVAVRPPDVEAARVQAMSLLGAFSSYNSLIGQLGTRYKSAQKP